MTHTPGPWKSAVNDSGSMAGIKAAEAPGTGIICYMTNPVPGNEEGAANARLIASAPEMAEAIEKAGRVVGQLLDGALTGKKDITLALSQAHDALGPIYYRATGQPLRWWAPF
jgi:hypothetical protein